MFSFFSLLEKNETHQLLPAPTHSLPPSTPSSVAGLPKIPPNCASPFYLFALDTPAILELVYLLL